MNQPVLKAVWLILISLGLALIFNFLFFEKLIGISVFIFALILLGAVSLLGLRQNSLRKSWWLIVLIIFFALMPGIRDNELLTFLNVCAILGLLMLLAHELNGTPTFLMRIRDYIALAIVTPFQMLGVAVATVGRIGQIKSNVKNHDVWFRVSKGVIMAIPVLIIFAVLFSQADLAFSKFLNNIIDINISERTVQYLVLLVLSFVSALSFLSYILFPKKYEPELFGDNSGASIQSGKGIEVMVFLGLIATLFLVFIGFQVTYLFGGETNIIDAGFTYAEYARRGFFELLAVAILSLLMLLASEKYSGNRAQAEQSSYDGVESKKDKRFLMPALMVIIEVGVVIFSALTRLSLYVDAYGMTILRFYVAGFIVLLSGLFILLAIKFIISKREQFFAFGTLLSIAGFLIAVNFMNPDAFIAAYNIEHYTQIEKVDVSYIGWLSTDAEAEKIELYKKLEGEDKEVLRKLLQKNKDGLLERSGEWQSTNLSRTRALKLLNKVEGL